MSAGLLAMGCAWSALLGTGCDRSGDDGAGAAGPTAVAPETRSNVLLIVADDLGTDMLASYGVGADPPETPVLDHLAQRGVRFTSAWSHPICSPSRASLLTGKTASESGIGWNTSVSPVFSIRGIELSETTLPELLTAGTNGGYASAAIGKWHLGHTPDVGGLEAPNRHGFDHFAGPIGNLLDHYAYTKVVDGVETPSTTYALTEQIDDALAWITSTHGPWFCYLAFNSTHAPLQAPPAGLHTVDLTPTGDPTKDKRAIYEAMVQAMDTEIGRLLSSLGTELDNTNVIFVSDNGTPGSLSLGPFGGQQGKGTMYEGGINVPMLVAGPAVAVAAEGSSTNALVHLSDVYATVAELVHVDVAATIPPGTLLDSVSVVPYLHDPTHPPRRETLVSEYFFPNGPGAGAPVPLPQLDSGTCQSNLTVGGPGTTTLSLCGGFLAVGNDVTLEVSGAPPFAYGAVFHSWSFVPQSFNGGFLTALPAFEANTFTTDAFGTATLGSVNQLGADVSVYMQAVVEDPAVAGGFALSNTIQARYHPWNLKAARDARYKLVRSVNGGPTELYDLLLDPLEQHDLLGRGTPLGPKHQAAYDRLATVLAEL